MMLKHEVDIEIGMAIEEKEKYFKNRDFSPFNDLMFQFWCGVEIGLCLASGRLKPSYGEYYFKMPYKEYYNRCSNFFDKIIRDEELQRYLDKGLIK